MGGAGGAVTRAFQISILASRLPMTSFHRSLCHPHRTASQLTFLPQPLPHPAVQRTRTRLTGTHGWLAGRQPDFNKSCATPLAAHDGT